jgi:hypothetical protein
MSGRAASRAAMGNRDANHADVTQWYEELYCRVIDTHMVGGGYGDITVMIPTKRGAVVQVVEIKTADGTLRPSQQRFLAEWGPAAVAVICTREDVFNHCDRVRSGK